MQKILAIFLMFFSCQFVFAAPSTQKDVLWEVLEATPKKTSILDDVVDATNLNDVVEATGRKLDYDRTPLDNKVYKTRVNPRIPETKKAMGNTAMKKLLKVSGWGYAATFALESLLEGIDWVIDPEAQSIWRNKRSDPSYSCSYVTSDSSGNRQIKRFYYSSGVSTESFCPYEVAEFILKYRATWPGYEGKELKFDKWDPVLTPDSTTFRFLFTVTDKSSGYQSSDYLSVSYKIEPYNPPSSEKEYLTDDALADYMLGTHKDFNDEKYKKDLPKPNTWTSVANVFKPENRFEEENSPTVKVVTTHLDQTNPESEDGTISPDKDSEGNPTGGFSLPSFCSWATTVCEFIGWYKTEPELIDEPLEIEDKEIIAYERQDHVQFGQTCPFSPETKTLPMGVLGSIEVETDLTFICSFGVEARPYVLALGHLGALIFLLIGLRNGNA